jgi:hypothetical protein
MSIAVASYPITKVEPRKDGFVSNNILRKPLPLPGQDETLYHQADNLWEHVREIVNDVLKLRKYIRSMNKDLTSPEDPLKMSLNLLTYERALR